MEHCVFCAFLSTGKDYRDCGRPCDTHVVTLRDRVGAELPLKADAGCRNTVYNNRAQTGADYVARLLELGARSFRALEERRDDLKDKATSALPEVRRMKRDELKLAHIDAVRAMQPAWLDHFEALRRFAPDPASVVLDGLSAQIAGTEVEFTRDGKFMARPEIRFVLDGEAKDRETADALRDVLVKERSYTLSSSGADARGGRRLPYPFAYTLRTVELAPKQPAGGER
jgi:hypothetical protein